MKKYMVSILVVALVVSNAVHAGLGADIDNFVHRHKTAIKVGVAAAGVAGALALLVKTDWQATACDARELQALHLSNMACNAQLDQSAMLNSCYNAMLFKATAATCEQLAALKELVLVKGAQAQEMFNLAEVSQNFSQAAALAGQSLNKAGAGFDRFVQGAMCGGEKVGAKVGACMGAILAGEIALLGPVVAAQAVVVGAIKASRKVLGLRS